MAKESFIGKHKVAFAFMFSAFLVWLGQYIFPFGYDILFYSVQNIMGATYWETTAYMYILSVALMVIGGCAMLYIGIHYYHWRISRKGVKIKVKKKKR